MVALTFAAVGGEYDGTTAVTVDDDRGIVFVVEGDEAGGLHGGASQPSETVTVTVTGDEAGAGGFRWSSRPATGDGHRHKR